ncbi:MAG: CDGSH iron-sulfur domain-containing protein [Acetobacteraceae bacterium]|nr:CDGSH iron-sulfur domain-containing protein [Acetobacteraceae bacterium]
MSEQTSSAPKPAVPHIAQKAPFAVEVEEGKIYFWCACGLSSRQPFCDGSHKGTDMQSLKWTADKSGKVWFCGCKATARQPMCDGRHKAL